MSMPISSPPNALAHATGFVDTNGMAKSGILLGLIGLVLVYVMMFVLARLHFFGDPKPTVAPAPAAAAVISTPAVSAPVDTTVQLNAEAAAAVQVADSAKVDSAAPVAVDSSAAK